MPQDTGAKGRLLHRQPGKTEDYSSKRFFEESESGLFDLAIKDEPVDSVTVTWDLASPYRAIKEEPETDGQGDFERKFSGYRPTCFSVIYFGACIAMIASVLFVWTAREQLFVRHEVPSRSHPAEDAPRKEIGLTKPFDFALYANGARVVWDLTTRGASPSILEVFLALPFGGIQVGRTPRTALEAGTEEGHCWFIKGTSAVLGIHLSNNVAVQNVTIDHVHPAAALDISSAPRHMALWGVVVEPTAPSDYGLQLDSTCKLLEMHGFQTCLNQTIALLSKFEYSISAGPTSQTFPVLPMNAKATELAFRTVILEIEDNWGSDESTCLYKVGVHGRRERRPAIGH